MAGMDRETGKPLDGWAHVSQSLADIFTTAMGARVMRREYGADIRRLVDAPMSPATLVDFYAAAAHAVDKDEPRFKVTKFGTVDATTDGNLTVECDGIYYPRGHLGDYSISQPANAVVLV